MLNEEKPQDPTVEEAIGIPENVQQEAELEKEEISVEDSAQKAEYSAEVEEKTMPTQVSSKPDEADDPVPQEESPKSENTSEKEAPVSEEAAKEISTEQEGVPTLESTPSKASIEIDTVAEEEASTDLETSTASDADPNVAQESRPEENDVENESAEEEVENKEEASEEEEGEEEFVEDLDFTNATKEAVLDRIRDVSKDGRIKRIDQNLKVLRSRFDELFNQEKEEALTKFTEEGNDPEAFEFQGSELDREFEILYRDLRSKRNQYYRDLESQKEENLKKKEQLLEDLRVIVDGEEFSGGFNKVKKIQEDWRKTGPVPGAHNKTLWANYNALLDRFFDQRSIYFELKDLDRKKNLKIKQELCEKAETLAQMEDLKSAIMQLNELHEEYKKAGAVPKENQEALWQRFKAASDTVYARRKGFFEDLKQEFEANLVKKIELAQEAETYVSFDSDSISEWNKKTKEIQEIQKKWEAIGGLPRDKAKAVNKQFWGAFKKFFATKNQFFKRLESSRDDNMKKKEALIQRAEELKESTDFNETTQKYKDLQAEWKEIGPVPEKNRNELYKRFKSACDHFFDRRRGQNSEQEKAYEENLNMKFQISKQIEEIVTGDEINLDDIYALIDNHAQIGFVPRNAIKKEKVAFENALQKVLDLDDLEAGDKKDLENHIRLSHLKNAPDSGRRMQREEHSIRRKISELENDINTWNTNMEFFASSATADKLKAEMQERIGKAEEELKELKAQLSSLSS